MDLLDLTSWERKFLKKGSLTKTCHEYVTHSTKELMVLTSLRTSCFGFVSSSLLVVAASALLAPASSPSSIRRGLGQCSIWAPFWRGARARAPGYRSRGVRACTLNSATTRASGVQLGINRQQWSARSVALAFHAGPWEARVRDSKKPCLREIRSYHTLRLWDYHGTTAPFLPCAKLSSPHDS